MMCSRHAFGLAVMVVVGGFGCDKIRERLSGGSAEGGAPSGGGSVLSFLDPTFEGEITVNVTGKADKTPKTFLFDLKSPRARIDAAAGQVNDNPMLAQGFAFIIDPPVKKGYVLIPAKKQAVIIDFEKAKQMKAHGGGGGPGGIHAGGTAEPPPKFEKTGKKDVVAGYTCEIVKVTTQKGERSELCVAENVKWIDLSDLATQSPELAAAAAVTDINHLPLRIVTFDAQNVETGRMEATKIEKKKIDDTRFTIPPDYQQIDLAAMLGGMAAGAGKAPPGFPPSHRGR